MREEAIRLSNFGISFPSPSSWPRQPWLSVWGATSFFPTFIMLLSLRPDVAIGTVLITQVFGFASGVFAYSHKRLIDKKLGIMLLITTVPLALLGALLSGIVPSETLNIILGMGLMAIAMSFLRAPDHKEVDSIDQDIGDEHKEQPAGAILVTARGEEIRCTV